MVLLHPVCLYAIISIQNPFIIHSSNNHVLDCYLRGLLGFLHFLFSFFFLCFVLWHWFSTILSSRLLICSWKWKWKLLSHVRLLVTPWTVQVHGIFQARILEWVAVPFSRGSSQPRDQTQVSHIAGRFFTSWATREAQICSYASLILLLIPSNALFISVCSLVLLGLW